MPARINHIWTDDDIELKRCGCCREWLELPSFSRRSASWDGLSARCKGCDKGYSRQWFESNRDQHYENTRRWVEANPDGRAAIRKRWNDANADYFAKWREDNAERKKQNDAAWYEANKDRHREYGRAWREANPDAYREHARAYSARRRARVLALPHEPWTDQQIIDRDGMTCWMCSRPVGGVLPHGARDWHVDHLIPLALDYPDHPGDTLANLAIACAGCNYDKNMKLLPEAVGRYLDNLERHAA